METNRLIKRKIDFYVSNKLGNLLLYKELNNKEKLFITKKVLSEIFKNKNIDPYIIFSNILYTYGIMCPHPKIKRKQLDLYKTCDACGTIIMNHVVLDDEDDLSNILIKAIK